MKPEQCSCYYHCVTILVVIIVEWSLFIYFSFIGFSVVTAFQQTQTVLLTAFNLFFFYLQLHCSCVALGDDQKCLLEFRERDY